MPQKFPVKPEMTEDSGDSVGDILLSESELSRHSSTMLEDIAAGQDATRPETLTITDCCFMRLFAQLSSSD